MKKKITYRTVVLRNSVVSVPAYAYASHDENAIDKTTLPSFIQAGVAGCGLKDAIRVRIAWRRLILQGGERATDQTVII